MFKNQNYDYINSNDAKAIIYVYKLIQSSKIISVYFIFEFQVKLIQIYLNTCLLFSFTKQITSKNNN